jgi:hypothetical protein
MSKRIQWLVALLLTITAVCIVAVVFMAAHRSGNDDEDEEEAVKTPSHLLVDNGHTVIRLSPQIQAREGIRSAPLGQISRRAESRAAAVLLPLNDLATLRNNYLAARTKWQTDQVTLKVARLQEQRVTSLYQQNQNMSLKAVQDADAALRTAQAQVEADAREEELQLDAVRQRWGAALAIWVAGNSPTLTSILAQRSLLAQVIFPVGEVAQPPAKLTLSSPLHQLIPATLVGPMPQVNPQIQSISFLYLVPSRPGIAVGMNLLALVPVGPLLHGTLIPAEATVWWQGKLWVYQQTSDNTFARREVQDANPVANGYFVPGQVFPPGTKIVTAGAQTLLSEDFRGDIQEED